MKAIIQESGPFRVELEFDPDNEFDFSHYGKFCELPRSPYGRFDHSVHARNSPDHGNFYLKNPGAWVKRDLGNGTDSWVRQDMNHQYGWFKLAEHPKWQVESLMKDGMNEREAWRKVLDDWEDTVAKLANNDLYAMWLRVEVFWNDESVGEESLGGIEAEEYFGEAEAIEAAKEHGLIDSALAQAKKKINEMYGVAPTAPNNEAHNAPDNAAMCGKE